MGLHPWTSANSHTGVEPVTDVSVWADCVDRAAASTAASVTTAPDTAAPTPDAPTAAATIATRSRRKRRAMVRWDSSGRRQRRGRQRRTRAPVVDDVCRQMNDKTNDVADNGGNNPRVPTPDGSSTYAATAASAREAAKAAPGPSTRCGKRASPCPCREEARVSADRPLNSLPSPSPPHWRGRRQHRNGHQRGKSHGHIPMRQRPPHGHTPMRQRPHGELPPAEANTADDALGKAMRAQ